MSEGRPLLEVAELTKHYQITEGVLDEEVGRAKAVDGISFEVARGETFGIVGESGCGKSTAVKSLLRLEEPTAGSVRFDGKDITEFNAGELRRFRRRAQMIFQDSDSSFDPRMNVREVVAEPLVVQGMTDPAQRYDIIAELLERVGLSAEDAERYPHEFSGGQKQRIGLARALAVSPELLIADEPVSALDISIQSEILDLLEQFQADLGLAIVFISHDLSVIREICDRVAVMYLGEFVEVGPTEKLFKDPKHPYTRALLSAIPTPDPTDSGLGVTLTGTVPDPSSPPSGCRFHTRCPEVIQPDEIDIPQENWRQIIEFRTQLDNDGIDLENIVEAGMIRSDRQSSDFPSREPTDIDDRQLKRWIREEYNFPATLSDVKAEEALREAVELLIAKQEEAASKRLKELFTTVCETDNPGLKPCGANHDTACHLLQDESDTTTVDNDSGVSN